MAQNLGNLFIDGEGVIEDKTGTHTVTVGGNAAISSAQTTSFGATSIRFGGKTDYLNVPYHSDFDFGTGDFTIDFCLSLDAVQTATPDRGIFTTDSYGGNGITILESNSFVELQSGGSTARIEIPKPSSGEFHHYAFQRIGNNIHAYVDGVLYGQSWTTINSLNTDVSGFYIGSREYSPSTKGIAGYMDNIRVIVGEALWTSNFDSDNLEAMFYLSPPSNPKSLASIYHAKQTKIRGKAKQGFVRPTISQFFTSKDFKDVLKPPPV